MRQIFLPISGVSTLIAALTFVSLPVMFFAAQLEAMSEQSAVSFPLFGLGNNLAMVAAEMVGIAIIFGSFVSRSHWVFSSILSVWAIACGVVTTVGALLYFAVRFLH